MLSLVSYLSVERCHEAEAVRRPRAVDISIGGGGPRESHHRPPPHRIMDIAHGLVLQVFTAAVLDEVPPCKLLIHWPKGNLAIDWAIDWKMEIDLLVEEIANFLSIVQL